MKKLLMFLLTLFCLGTSALLAPSATGERPKKKGVTFNKDVAPIFLARCVKCHREGEAAPMSLASYIEARPWARSIREKVLLREMPPWHADPHIGQFRNDRRLTQDEIDTIVSWVDGGAKEGDRRQSPRAPKYVDGWNIGTPDLVLSMPKEITLNAAGTDEYYYLELPANFTEDRYVKKIEVRPGNHKVVHHLTAFILAPPMGMKSLPDLTKEQMAKIRAMMEKGSIFYYEGELSRVRADAPVYDDGCVLPSGGSATSRDGSGGNWTSLATPLVVYSPGVNPVEFDEGMARRIPAGSKIFVQAHYWKAKGTVEKDRSMIGLVFAKSPPEKQVLTQLLINNYFMIPPGAARHRVNACWTTDKDIQIISFMPHMHWRGVSMRVEAFYPDGKSEVLLNVPNYRFAWQTVYYLEKPKDIPKGTKLSVEAIFDNSANNRYNPDPAQAVRAGEPTYDEMMASFIDYTVADQGLRGDGVKANK
jgi:hypothetical protein